MIHPDAVSCQIRYLVVRNGPGSFVHLISTRESGDRDDPFNPQFYDCYELDTVLPGMSVIVSFTPRNAGIKYNENSYSCTSCFMLCLSLHLSISNRQ